MTSLKDHLTTLPWVQAGPILRKVTAKSVTVWVALQETALITLSVKDDTNTAVATGTRSTVAVGANLHIAAVTAQSADRTRSLPHQVRSCPGSR